jgi:uncharacterized protein YggE
MEAIRSQGISDSDIETTDVVLAKNQQWDPKTNTYQDLGYRQTTTMRVTINDLSKVGAVLDAAVAGGANNVQDVAFQLKPETEAKYKQQELAAATKVATQKAAILADAAGTRLGKLVSLTEQSYNYVPWMYNAKNALAAADGGATVAPTPINPQKVSISVSVSLAYELN